MKWLIQRPDEPRALEMTGTFDEAVQCAKYRCQTKEERCFIFELPANVRMAEVSAQGLLWTAPNWFTDGLLLSPEHPEWVRMWLSLYRVTGSYSDRNPESGERWQYQGTFWKNRSAIGSLSPIRVLVHEFRHRDRPEACPPIGPFGRWSGRVVLHLSASHAYSGNWNHPIPEGTLL